MRYIGVFCSHASTSGKRAALPHCFRAIWGDLTASTWLPIHPRQA
jgi:hypothetical protein